VVGAEVRTAKWPHTPQTRSKKETSDRCAWSAPEKLGVRGSAQHWTTEARASWPPCRTEPRPLSQKESKQRVKQALGGGAGGTVNVGPIDVIDLGPPLIRTHRGVYSLTRRCRVLGTKGGCRQKAAGKSFVASEYREIMHADGNHDYGQPASRVAAARPVSMCVRRERLQYRMQRLELADRCRWPGFRRPSCRPRTSLQGSPGHQQ
jgi:hypothetical protein